ncbi:DNA methyltransferase, partial [Winogradskyella sp.]
GGLFRDTIVSPKFTKEARKIIIECGDLDWSEINPDIFGSMIQAVVNPAYRSGLGMHYTSVPNIMKVIEPLFLNELYEEFEKQKDNPKKLRQLIYRISKLKIFDPACGSGNFLIIAYKELRKLEIQIWQQINELEPQYSFVFTEVKLSQFYGIELDDFAHEMAILSLWLAEHQMNKIFVDELFDFGKAKPILPLKEAGHITQGNATRLNWEDTCPIDLADEAYILGNPPYLGTTWQDETQKEDKALTFDAFKSYKKLDYIACWFKKGVDYIINFNAQFAFVSTNSICQGEQVALLWPYILAKCEIGFAHQSFKWTNNAKGNAGVTVIIVGIMNLNQKRQKRIYTDNKYKNVSNISPYLTDASNIIVQKRSKPISNLPQMSYGNKAVDGGHLILNEIEKNQMITENESSRIFIKELIGSNELINGSKRWCLWIPDDSLTDASNISSIKERIERVKETRLKSKDSGANELAERAHQFRDFKSTIDTSIVVPRVSSERREYMPIILCGPEEIILDSAQVLYDVELYVFGIISSKIHTVWVKAVSGGLETRIGYSNSICYNAFPFPEINQKQKEQINLHVFEVLEEREKHSGKTLAQLYDPDKMPKGLKEAHHQLDLAIERCYRLKPFESDTERLEYLFAAYEKMINKNTLLEKPKRTRKKKA